MSAHTHTHTERCYKQNAWRQTCVKVSVTESLQDAVHGPHVEQETKLSDGHGHQAEQEHRVAHSFHEGLGCRRETEIKQSVNDGH